MATIKPRVFFDADVLIAASASPNEHSASLVILRMAEITLIEGITSEQAVVEVERNLSEKLPAAVNIWRVLYERCLTVVPAPSPTDLAAYAGLADPKDVSILAAAVQAQCTWLLTFNTRHFQPGHPDIQVVRPGEFVLRLRELLTYL